VGDVVAGSIRGPVVILWIFPWMIGASLVLAGYLRYRHGQRIVAAASRLIPVRVEARSAARR